MSSSSRSSSVERHLARPRSKPFSLRSIASSTSNESSTGTLSDAGSSSPSDTSMSAVNRLAPTRLPVAYRPETVLATLASPVATSSTTLPGQTSPECLLDVPSQASSDVAPPQAVPVAPARRRVTTVPDLVSYTMPLAQPGGAKRPATAMVPPPRKRRHTTDMERGTSEILPLSDSREVQVTRKKSLIKPERAYRRSLSKASLGEARGTRRSELLTLGGLGAGLPTSPSMPHFQIDPLSRRERYHPWVLFTRIVTFYAPSALLAWSGIKTIPAQKAWREKMALCTVIAFCCGALAFITFGFQQAVCGERTRAFPANEFHPHVVNIRGSLYDVRQMDPAWHPVDINWDGVVGRDVSWLFPIAASDSVCPKVSVRRTSIDCVVSGAPNWANLSPYCHSPEQMSEAWSRMKAVGRLTYDWADIRDTSTSQFMVFNNVVLDMRRYFEEGNRFLGDNTDRLIRQYIGRDATSAFVRTPQHLAKMKCMLELFTVGVMDAQTVGCIASNVLMMTSLFAVLAIVMTRFILAIGFSWFISRKLGRIISQADREKSAAMAKAAQQGYDVGRRAFPLSDKLSSRLLPKTSRFSSHHRPHQPSPIARPSLGPKQTVQRPASTSSSSSSSNASLARPPFATSSETLFSVEDAALTRVRHQENDALSTHQSGPSSVHSQTYLKERFEYDDPTSLPTIVLVTCYSEEEEAIRGTLDSVAGTDFPEERKLIVVIADGLITGSGNLKSTPDIILEMIDMHPSQPLPAQPQAYFAIADGRKQFNMAQVYAGYYHYEGQRVPTIVVVKCGGPQEIHGAKPGNRGKRDSQIILMSFLSKVLFDERMSPLEYTLYEAIQLLTGHTADRFELVLMVDADTKVMPDALRRMVTCMYQDPMIMGLCGETRIANKASSWITMIQVFEYYISHHLSKAFESVFGGVTCLPGCFCMYRIKAPKGRSGYHVPILASPDIVALYSENVVDTLHKKNLLLLGEDRYLTTLMLRSFPKRKMVFVPAAVCKTVVPDTFRVLLSQRRRWINSTIHNLLELVLVRDLCGIFCFSMQFVIGIELLGTVVLPAAILFTVYLLILSCFSAFTPILPLILLTIILGLPAVLIVLTSQRLSYVPWMLIYICALPIWNFILPVYAFWHFDDFSWGQTRKVHGEVVTKAGDHAPSTQDDTFDAHQLVMKKWTDWEAERRQKPNSEHARQRTASSTITLN